VEWIKLARFWSKVRVGLPEDCWEWLANENDNGYGRVTQDGQNLRAHRVAYEIANGPVPDGLIVLHKCDNRKCCNPAHLMAGTHADNFADMVAKGRERWSKGSQHPKAKLTPDDVAQIRASNDNNAILAERFGVSKSSISMVRNYRRHG
jgi:hypothetical protein